MTPSVFTKLGLRLLALHMALFIALPGFLYLGMNLAAIRSVVMLSYLLQMSVTAGIAIWLWLSADRLLAIVLPAGAAREIPPDYPYLQGLAFMFAGGLLALDGVYWLTDAISRKDVAAAANGAVIGLVGLVLFCEPAWRRRH